MAFHQKNCRRDGENTRFITSTELGLLITMPSSNGPRQGTRKKLQNNPRERGTSPPQRAVQSFEAGETVHLAIDPSIDDGRFHPRFNGHTGEIVGQQGAAYKIRINDGGAEKTIIATPAHLQAQEE